jgi:hypothetical protein
MPNCSLAVSKKPAKKIFSHAYSCDPGQNKQAIHCIIGIISRIELANLNNPASHNGTGRNAMDVGLNSNGEIITTRPLTPAEIRLIENSMFIELNIIARFLKVN